jgi:hypothetical protein
MLFLEGVKALIEGLKKSVIELYKGITLNSTLIYFRKQLVRLPFKCLLFRSLFVTFYII